MKRCWPLAMVLILTSSGIAGAQPASPPPEDWEFAFTPYLWGSGIDGTVGIGGQEADFEVSAKDLVESLDFAFMANFGGRKDRWSFSIDFDYTDLGKDVTAENTSVPVPDDLRLDMSMAIVEGDVGYQVVNSVDFLAGIRRVSGSAGLTTDQGTIAEVDGGFTDPIVGARFHRYLSEKLWVNIRGDVGGFGAGSEFSWFVSAVGGFRVSSLISLDFGYRIWDFDYESDDDFKKLDLALAGFGGGLTFHF